MTSINNQQSSTQLSLPDLIARFKDAKTLLFSKWKFVVIFCIVGSVLGIVASFVIKPKYQAHLSFALVEQESDGGLADLVSMFGFSGLMGGTQNAFSGDNLLEILKTRHAIESTLLCPVDFNGKKQTLADAFIEVKELRKRWETDSKHPGLSTLNYPIGQERSCFSRVQDSVLFTFYTELSEPKNLEITRKDKKLSFVSVDFTSTNESFSKLFVEKLMERTYEFYRQTKTSQSRANVAMMQSKADSVRVLYESSLRKGASYSAINVNPALQLAAVPRIKQENSAQLYAATYAEVLKNLEALKLDLARETPIVQIIDKPIYPLKVTKIGHLKGLVFGTIIGFVLSLLVLFFKYYYEEQQKPQIG